jgi:hypothetical protein
MHARGTNAAASIVHLSRARMEKPEMELRVPKVEPHPLIMMHPTKRRT